jgi:hypothetical protein
VRVIRELQRALFPHPAATGNTEDAEAAADEAELRAAIHAAYIEVQKTKIDRTFRSADFLTRAAGTIATVYTGLLALVYSVGTKSPHPLPARGIAPAVFLALAFFFSVVNVGFVWRSGKRVDILAEAKTWKEQQVRLVRYMQWIDRGALQRAWALRTAVVCLGAGVALLPLPFLSVSTKQTRACVVVAGAAVVLWLLLEIAMAARAVRRARRTRPDAPVTGIPWVPEAEAVEPRKDFGAVG